MMCASEALSLSEHVAVNMSASPIFEGANWRTIWQQGNLGLGQGQGKHKRQLEIDKDFLHADKLTFQNSHDDSLIALCLSQSNSVHSEI